MLNLEAFEYAIKAGNLSFSVQTIPGQYKVILAYRKMGMGEIASATSESLCEAIEKCVFLFDSKNGTELYRRLN